MNVKIVIFTDEIYKSHIMESEYRQGDSNVTVPKPVRKFYRDLDGNVLTGVCSGLALYFRIDVVLVRIIFIAAVLLGTAGFWVYLVLFIIAPAARTATEKCELHGLPLTEENLKRFSRKK